MAERYSPVLGYFSNIVAAFAGVSDGILQRLLNLLLLAGGTGRTDQVFHISAQTAAGQRQNHRRAEQPQASRRLRRNPRAVLCFFTIIPPLPSTHSRIHRLPFKPSIRSRMDKGIRIELS